MAETSISGILPTESLSAAERPSKRRRTSMQPYREVGLMRNVPGDKFSGFVGSASGIYFIKSVYSALRHEESAPQSVDTPVSDIVPGEDDRLPSVLPHASKQLWDDNEVSPSSDTLVSFQELVELSASYFANWHTLFPFLCAPVVLDYFQQISRDVPPSFSTSKDARVIILRSIMSISLADQRQANNPNNMRYRSEIVFTSFENAIDHLQHVLSRPTSIIGLQATMSVQLFLVSMLRLNAASRIGGLINRMALQLGLHRCSVRYSSFSEVEKELRQRIFWVLYALDRFICQSMGLPLGLSDDDCDVCFPSAELHLNGVPDMLRDRRLRMMDLIARESRLRGEIIELRNKSLHYIQRDPDQATAIAAQLAHWWNAVEELNDVESTQRLSAYNLTILTLLKHESVISLHRPILATSRRGVDYDAALQLCIGSARSIITLLHNAISNEGSDRKNSLCLLWPSCTWAIWISTFVLLYAANNQQLPHTVVMKLADRSIQVLAHLARRGSAWPEASAAAIRSLRCRMIDRAKATASAVEKDAPHDNVPGHYDHSYSNVTGTNVSATSPSPKPAPTTAFTADYGLPNLPQTLESQSIPAPSTTGHELPWDPQAEMSSGVPRFYDAAFEPDPAVFDHIMQGMYPSNDSTGAANFDALDPFSGFDIPFWFEQDQEYQEWNIFKDYI